MNLDNAKHLELTLPGPLLDPTTWVSAKHQRLDVWVLRFEWLQNVRGPLHNWMMYAIESGPFIWRIAVEEWSRNRLHSPLLRHPNLQMIWLEELTSPFEPSEVSGPAVMRAPTPGPSLAEWANALFPSFAVSLSAANPKVNSAADVEAIRSSVGFSNVEADLQLNEMLDRYSSELECHGQFPWTALSYYPVWLRRMGYLDWAELAARDRLRLEALYSPQDEERETLALADDELKMNPTLQILQSGRGREGRIEIFVRSRGQLLERNLDWQEAAILDELAEWPRMRKQDLIAHLAAVAAKMSQADRASLVMLRSFSDVLQRLIEEKVILARLSV
jgi:hypothetical protein